MNMRKAALVAALAQMLWGLLIVVPQVFGFESQQGTDWIGRELALFECLALAIFLFAVYWKPERMNGSIRVRFAALVAAICLGIENLPLTYGTIRGVVSSLKNVLDWEDHPFLSMRYVLVPAIPTIVVISLIAFLVFVYRPSPRVGQLAESDADGHLYNGVRIAALLAFIASVVAVGQLFFFIATTPIWQTSVFTARFVLRLLSLTSLALFFFLVQAARPQENDLNEAKSW
jgi:hypothetical protein